MREIIRGSLEKLSKEQLMIIINAWHKQLICISETCVEESKCHIEPEEAVQKIREYLWKADRYDILDDNLGAYIDMQQGNITPKEYRKIVLGEE